jgi:hypothetical protein
MTTPHGLPLQASTDAADFPNRVNAIKDAVEACLPVVQTGTPAHKLGLIWFHPTTRLAQISDGTQWGRISPLVVSDSATVVAPALSVTGNTAFGVTYSAPPKVFIQVTNAENIAVNVTSVTTTLVNWYAYVSSGNPPSINHTVNFNCLIVP